ncbi:hypothetical protein ABVK25_011918 [Lepraria finkii]|uniref:Uncharacterized protein n=1 Tax=Lepraria finkii TaxID=1340010 RepID=A0ABR4AKB0_9LECA
MGLEREPMLSFETAGFHGLNSTPKWPQRLNEWKQSILMLPSPHHFDKSAHVQGTIVKSDPDIHAIDQDSRGRDSGGSRHRQAKEKASPRRELMALSGSAASPLEDIVERSLDDGCDWMVS